MNKPTCNTDQHRAPAIFGVDWSPCTHMHAPITTILEKDPYSQASGHMENSAKYTSQCSLSGKCIPKDTSRNKKCQVLACVWFLTVKRKIRTVNNLNNLQSITSGADCPHPETHLSKVSKQTQKLEESRKAACAEMIINATETIIDVCLVDFWLDCPVSTCCHLIFFLWNMLKEEQRVREREREKEQVQTGEYDMDMTR